MSERISIYQRFMIVCVTLALTVTCAFGQTGQTGQNGRTDTTAAQAGTPVGAGTTLADAAVFYNEGNTAYRAENFSEAAELYRHAIAAGANNSAVYYNLGNAEYRLGHVGPAVLNYERALRLDPTHEDARANLKFIAELRTDQSESEDVEQQLTTALHDTLSAISQDWLALAFLIGLAGVCVILSWWLLGGGRTGMTVAILVFAAILSVGGIGIQGARTLTSDEGSAAIVLRGQIEARFEPSLTARVAFVLHEGTKVQVERYEDTWALIQVPNGLRGWVPRSSFDII